VQLPRKQSQLFTAPGGTSRWHGGVLVVVDGATDRPKQACLVEILL